MTAWLFRLGAICFALFCCVANATTYYVSNSGSDTNSGTSVNAPWQSIAKVNRTTFAGGDEILFAGGQTFGGGLGFDQTDAATAANPITISSYGTGRATIAAGYGNGFVAYNCAGFFIWNINFYGNGPTVNTSDGVNFFADANNNDVLDGISIYQVDVSGFGGQGISVGSSRANNYYRNVTISFSSVHDNLQGGIATFAQQPFSLTNIYIGDCVVYNNFGDPAAVENTGNGIVLGGVSIGVVEYCVSHDNGKNNFVRGKGPVGIWCHNSEYVYLQFNEAHHNHTSSAQDGGGFDLDINTRYSVMQYNYSHDNDGAGLLLCCDSDNTGNIVRYNITENDARKNSYGSIHTYGAVTGALIYHNSVFLSNTSPTPIALLLVTPTVNTRIHNNIFQTSEGATLVWMSSGQNGLVIQGNDYWSTGGSFVIVDGSTTYSSLATWRSSTGYEKLNGTNTGFELDPRLTSPGDGETLNDANLLPMLSAYQLRTNSPMLDAGLNLPKLEVNVGMRDFYGVSVPQGIGFDVGAAEMKRAVTVKGTWIPPNFRIDAFGTLNKTNVIEASSNLVAWLALTNTTSGTLQFVDTNVIRNSRRFYRLRQ